MAVYIYESHLGGIYFSEYEYNTEVLYCERCGDWDWFIEEVETAEDAIACLADMISIDGCGGYDLEYILEQMNFFEEKISLEKAIEIVRENRKHFDEEDDSDA